MVDSEYSIRRKYEENKLRYPNAADETIIKKMAHNIAFIRKYGHYSLSDLPAIEEEITEIVTRTEGR